MPVKNNVILYESFAGAGMIDSPYAIFLEFLHNKKFDNYINEEDVANAFNKIYRTIGKAGEDEGYVRYTKTN